MTLGSRIYSQNTQKIYKKCGNILESITFVNLGIHSFENVDSFWKSYVPCLFCFLNIGVHMLFQILWRRGSENDRIWLNEISKILDLNFIYIKKTGNGNLVNPTFFLFLSKWIPSTPQHTDSHPRTRPEWQAPHAGHLALCRNCGLRWHSRRIRGWIWRFVRLL